MRFTTYILINEKRTRTYVGQTRNLEERLRLHNASRVKSTCDHGPWMLLYREEHPTRAEAMSREKWFKSRTGRKQIQDLLLERWPSG
ncbi:MAG: GIY-YIG nuclease family protein [Bacteroidota bacterium]